MTSQAVNGKDEEEGTIQYYRPGNRGKKLRVVVEQPLSSLTSRPTMWPLVQFNDDVEVQIVMNSTLNRFVFHVDDLDRYGLNKSYKKV